MLIGVPHTPDIQSIRVNIVVIQGRNKPSVNNFQIFNDQIEQNNNAHSYSIGVRRKGNMNCALLDPLPYLYLYDDRC